MKDRELVVSVINKVDRYYFQYRDGAQQKGAIGLTGCFGGKLKKNEIPQDGIHREVAREETEIFPPVHPTDFFQTDRFSVEATEPWLKLLKRKVTWDVRVFQ